MQIANRKIGPDQPCFIVAEPSGNHGGNLETAKQMILVAQECGADAVKLQTFTPKKMFDYEDTITDPILNPPWLGMKGKDIYRLTYMKNKRQLLLRDFAAKVGIILFSTVCDTNAVDFWEEHGSLPAYKIASWQTRDADLLYRVSLTEKPTIISVNNCCSLPTRGTPSNLAFLAKDNLRELPIMIQELHLPVGYSNHAYRPQHSADDPMIADTRPCIKAVKQKACIIEQHFTLSPNTIDGKFAATPQQFREMVQEIRALEGARKL